MENHLLVPDCEVQEKDIEECARYLCYDFGQIVTPIMGGRSDMVDLTSRFPKAKLRLLGSDKKKFKSAFLFTRKRQLDKWDKRVLARFASALARGMDLTLPSPCFPIPLNYDEIFPHDAKWDANELEFCARKTRVPQFTYMQADLNELVQKNVGACLLENVRSSNEESSPGKSTTSLFGVDLAQLVYDEEAGAIVRELFAFPEEETKKMINCISHEDARPSMEVVLKPLFWRSSKKMMDLLSREEDQALVAMYRGEEIKNTAFVKKKQQM